MAPPGAFKGEQMIPRRQALQYFSDEALERARDLTPTQIAQFLEEFRLLYGLKEAPPYRVHFKDLVDPDYPGPTIPTIDAQKL